MRAGRCLAVLLVASAALPAAAAAGPRVDFQVTFTKRTPGVSTGIDVKFLYKKPGDPKGKPTPVRQERVTFPLGTKFDRDAAARCQASDIELMLEGGSACPLDSWVSSGHGDTVMSGPPVSNGETPLEFNGYANGFNLNIVVRPKGFPRWFVAHAVTRGRVTTATIPRSPGGAPDGQTAVRRVHNVFPGRSRGRHVFARTPPVCPRSGRWRFEGRFTFDDGVVENDVYRMPCRRG